MALFLIVYPLFLTVILFEVAYQTSTYPIRLSEYTAAVQKVEAFNLAAENAYNDNFRKFNLLSQIYWHQYRSKEEIANSIEQFRRQKIRAALKHTVPYDGYTSKIGMDSNQQRFYGYLARYFSAERIHIGITFNHTSSESDRTPDFAYIDRAIRLCIDIEIDEPYVHISGEPTHFTNLWSDHYHNVFFLAQGWAIVRFSEEQTAHFPDACCKTIANLIYKIARDRTFLDQLDRIPDLPVMRQWTYTEAQDMARNNYRESYLALHGHSDCS